MALPSGITEGEFSDALKAFAAVVGKQWVLTGDAMLSYADPYAINAELATTPPAAIAPGGVEQVQRVLEIANTYRVPLWPISSGKNLGYGGASARAAGTVMLDLKRMNRILEVNEELAYALVEPGVSYFDLYNHLQENKIKLWVDPPSPGWGSIVGNTLERGVGYTPYGDHFMMQCGMEVVLADGNLVRTGMGALPDSNTWQLFKYGFGPYLDGLFTQSNFGVVTKMGVWLMPEPPGYRPYMITFPREEDLEQLVEILRPLKINMVIPNAAPISSLVFEASMKATKSQYHQGKGPLPPSAMKKIMRDQDIGMWNFYGALYGPEPIMDATWEVIRDAFSQVVGAKFFFAEDRPGDPAMAYRAKGMSGVPNLTEFSFVNWVGGGGTAFFSPIAPTTGVDAMKQYEMGRDRMNEFGFDYLGLFVIGWRELHHVMSLVFDRGDPKEVERAHESFRLMVADSAAAGYGEYRTHLAFMDQIANTYNWNDNALMRLNERLKDALDPNGILAPGKQGIWPKHMRGSRSAGHGQPSS